jgi:hypothetical protein
MATKKPKAESLKLEDLGNLDNYEDDELVWLREKLIADVERIQSESAHHAKRIAELNRARNDLQREQAERARALRAVKHTLHQRARNEGPILSAPVERRRAGVRSTATARAARYG